MAGRPSPRPAAANDTGDYREAAKPLNGFSRVDILNRLASLSDEQVGYLHAGAVDNPAVGPDSQVARLTAPDTPSPSPVEVAAQLGITGTGAGIVLMSAMSGGDGPSWRSDVRVWGGVTV